MTKDRTPENDLEEKHFGIVKRVSTGLFGLLKMAPKELSEH